MRKSTMLASAMEHAHGRAQQQGPFALSLLERRLFALQPMAPTPNDSRGGVADHFLDRE